MDPVLAQIYGTNSEASDLEKLAAEEMAEELASDGYDVGDASDDDIEMMAQAVLDDIQGDESEEYEQEVDDETMAKVAEADKLGRVMAHSMWQELGHIKEASHGPASSEDMYEAMSAGGESPASRATRKGKADSAKAEAARRAAHEEGIIEGHRRQMAHQHERGISRFSAHAHNLADSAGKHLARVGSSAGKAMRMSGPLSKGKAQAIGAGLYGLGTLGAGGLAAAAHHRSKRKHSSALGTLAEARALEILEANGIDPESLTKTASSPAEELSLAVEQGAWDILAQYGFEPAE